MTQYWYLFNYHNSEKKYCWANTNIGIGIGQYLVKSHNPRIKMLTRYEYSVKQTKLEPENIERRINILFLFTTRQLSSASYGQVLMGIDFLV